MRRRVNNAKTSSLTFLLKLLVLGCLTASSFMWGASKVRGKDLGKNGVIFAAFYLLNVFFTFMQGPLLFPKMEFFIKAQFEVSTYKQYCDATRVFVTPTITNKPASSLLGSSGFSSGLRAWPMVLSASTFSQSAPEGSTKKNGTI